MNEEELREEYRKCVESYEYFRDHYVLFASRPRTKEDFNEICRKIAEEQNISLKEALEIYKSDRDKWVKWYNEKFVSSVKGETLGAHLRNLLTPYKNLIALNKNDVDCKYIIIKDFEKNLNELIEFSNCNEMENTIYVKK